MAAEGDESKPARERAIVPGYEQIAADGGMTSYLPEGMPAMPGGLSMPAGMPAMPGGFSMPAMPEGMPAMPEGMPSMPEGMPAMPGGMPSMPEGMPSMPEGMPSMPEGMPAMPGGFSMPSMPEGMPGGFSTSTVSTEVIFSGMAGFSAAAAASVASMSEEDKKQADEIKSVFKQFDLNGDGLISKDELAAVFSKRGWTEEEVEEVWQTCDQNGDGKVDYDEFVNWVMGGDATKYTEEESA